MGRQREEVHTVVHKQFRSFETPTDHPMPWLQERITAGVSYVVSSKLALPHVTIRPAIPEAAAGPTVESLVNVLRDQVCHIQPALITSSDFLVFVSCTRFLQI